MKADTDVLRHRCRRICLIWFCHLQWRQNRSIGYNVIIVYFMLKERKAVAPCINDWVGREVKGELRLNIEHVGFESHL